jgi:putative flippase GtrA
VAAFFLQRLETMRASGLLGQLIRFGIVGVISSLIYSGVYLWLAHRYFPGPMAFAGVPFAFAIAVSVGFPLHSLWSFKGHGTRENSGRQHLKFVIVQGSGLLLNLGFTWVMTDLMRLPEWTPLVPAVTLIPLVTFWINRQWVFG